MTTYNWSETFGGGNNMLGIVRIGWTTYAVENPTMEDINAINKLRAVKSTPDGNYELDKENKTSIEITISNKCVVEHDDRIDEMQKKVDAKNREWLDMYNRATAAEKELAELKKEKTC